MNDFKEQLKSFIPRMEEMLRKEKEHRDFLCSQVVTPMIEGFINNSISFISRLEYRIEQYKNYIND